MLVVSVVVFAEVAGAKSLLSLVGGIEDGELRERKRSDGIRLKEGKQEDMSRLMYALCQPLKRRGGAGLSGGKPFNQLRKHKRGRSFSLFI